MTWARSALLAVLSGFFSTPLERPAPASDSRRGYLFNEAGFALQLARTTTEAAEPLEAAIVLAAEAGDRS